MPKFRKKPVVIEAKQMTDFERMVAISVWLDSQGVGNTLYSAYEITDDDDDKVVTGTVPAKLGIATLEGEITASMGDWIIRGVAGEFYPCKPDIFEQTYEPVDGAKVKP